MAKTYIDIVKYMVEARFEILGLAEKPDIIGAVFGQTEGLLGGGLDLRELQKNGKIGRIEIDSSATGNRTIGKLFLPSSLGRVETCILGATIESVDRVGPFETNFKINKIEDTRNEKRRKIVTRAKELLKTMLTTELPDSKEISEMVESDVKSSVVTTYGPEALPAGPDVASNEEIIFVEGRADVINLLKNDITNCVAVGGASGSIPKTIIELSKSKETTLFLDGDRGGDLILRGLSNVCDVDFVVRAPDGKEVEELTRKDIIKSLRAKVPIDQALSRLKFGDDRNQSRGGRFRDRPERPSETSQHSNDTENHQQPQQFQSRQTQQRSTPQQQRERPSERLSDERIMSPSEISRKMLSKEMNQPQQPSKLKYFGAEEIDHDNALKDLEGNDADFNMSGDHDEAESIKHAPEEKFVSALAELHNTLRGRIYGGGGELNEEMPIRDLVQKVQDSNGVNVLVFDGIITQRLADLAAKKGVKAIYAIRAAQISKPNTNMLLYTKEQGTL
jgi:DNA primase